ncbi:RidA family protein [Nocardia sp. NPDC051463]|uniref:RidA family protein n=1 Tax=Nocardia sp. NPDC051463 TaxID=3154845 RepID=UPI0034481DB5
MIPRGGYAATTEVGELLFISGQLAVTDGQLVASGIVGADIDLATAEACARACALNVLSQLEAATAAGSALRIVKLTVFVASSPDFIQQSRVADAASQLINEAIGTTGGHSRSAIGVAALPLGSPVEVEAIAAITDR